MQSIEISKTVFIRSIDEAIQHDIEQWYLEYFSEYDYRLEMLGKPPGGMATPEQEKAILKALDGMYAARIATKVLQRNPFLDLAGTELVVTQVALSTTRYQRGQTNSILRINLITEKLNLFHSFGSTLIMKLPSDTADRIVSIKLSDVYTIYNLSPDS